MSFTGGSRQQQLNLLFYILLPPDVLQNFLLNHPAGGVPTWLLEVGQDSVISLASLSHYYWYGGGSKTSPFLPSSTPTGSSPTKHWNKKQKDLALKIPARDAIHFFMSILVPEADVIVEDTITATNDEIEVSSTKDSSSQNGSKASTAASTST